MSITRRSIQQLQEILKENLPTGSNFVIAGGAARDILLSKRPKDIDVFISPHRLPNNSYIRMIKNHRFPFLTFVSSPSDQLENASYYTQSHIKVVLNYTYNFYTRVQLIILREAGIPEVLLNKFVTRTFDLNICKAYFNPRGEPRQTSEFISDCNEQKITLSFAHSFEGYAKSVSRAKKLIRTKFTGYRFLDTLKDLYVKDPKNILRDLRREYGQETQQANNNTLRITVSNNMSQRYLNGEISPEEYNMLMRQLNQTNFIPGVNSIDGWTYEPVLQMYYASDVPTQEDSIPFSGLENVWRTTNQTVDVSPGRMYTLDYSNDIVEEIANEPEF